MGQLECSSTTFPNCKYRRIWHAQNRKCKCLDSFSRDITAHHCRVYWLESESNLILFAAIKVMCWLNGHMPVMINHYYYYFMESVQIQNVVKRRWCHSPFFCLYVGRMNEEMDLRKAKRTNHRYAKLPQCIVSKRKQKNCRASFRRRKIMYFAWKIQMPTIQDRLVKRTEIPVQCKWKRKVFLLRKSYTESLVKFYYL